MKLLLQKETLLEKLILSSKFTSNKLSSLTALQGTLLKTEKKELHLYSTNLSCYFHTLFKIEESSSVEAVVEPSKLIEFLTLVPPGKTEVVIEEKTISFHQGKIKGRFPLINKEDFPLPPKIKTKDQETETEFLLKNLPLVLFTAAKDESRPVLSGINFTSDDEQIHIVSTDGFRLSLIKIKNKAGFPSMVIPSEFLGEVLRQIKEEKKMLFSYSPEEKMVVFKTNENEFYSRLIDGEFPPYEKVIPQEKKTTATVDKEELLRNVKLVSVFARDLSNIIICQFKKSELIIIPKTDDKDENLVSQEIELSGEEQKVAFNYKFLLEFLNNVSSKKITIEILRSDAPVVFKEEKSPDFLHIIMPVRIQE